MSFIGRILDGASYSVRWQDQHIPYWLNVVLAAVALVGFIVIRGVAAAVIMLVIAAIFGVAVVYTGRYKP